MPLHRDVPPKSEPGAESDSEGQPTAHGPYRIHTVAELTGVPEPTLRAWERRYGVPSPERTASGYRLYGAHEVHQVREMRRLCGEGMAAAEAARLVMAERAGVRAGGSSLENPYDAAVRALVDATARFDVRAFDEHIARAAYLGSSTAVFERILAPALVRIGDLWHDGELSVAHEHFASQRIATLVHNLGRLISPEESDAVAVVACFADEEHQIGALGVALRLATWDLRPVYLGPRTPPSAIASAVTSLAPKLVALSVTIPPERGRARELVDAYAQASGAVPWIVGGSAVDTVADFVRKAGGLVVASEVSALRAVVRLALGSKSKPSRGRGRRPARS